MQHPSLKQNAVTTRGNSTSPYSPQRKPEPFIGRDLLRSYESIIGDLSDQEILKIFKKEKSYFVNDVVWLRASQIFKGVFKVFEDEIEPNDILQGGLGDCYLLAALASLAEKPERIKDLFLTQEPNEEGLYHVLVCNRGIWQVVTVDDYFPCDRETRKPIFAKSNGNELWALLLEKAWAKIYGSYARISGGFPEECLRDFTGAPAAYYPTQDPTMKEQIWEEILSGKLNGYVMTCGISEKNVKEEGLLAAHAYSLLGALTSKNRSGSQVHLVKLRNPWGWKEWNKAYSDQSKDWTEEQKREFKIVVKEDGIFYMKIEDMLRYFDSIEICKVHDNYFYRSLKSKCDHLQVVSFRLPIKAAGQYSITINQESKRDHPKRDNYRESPVTIKLFKKVGNGYESVQDFKGVDRNVDIEVNLEEREYLVEVQIAWNQAITKEFTISSYGVNEVDIEQIGVSPLRNEGVAESSNHQSINPYESPNNSYYETYYDEHRFKNQMLNSFNSINSSQAKSDSNSSYYNSNSNYNNRNYDSDYYDSVGYYKTNYKTKNWNWNWN